MARAGINKALVNKARVALLARGAKVTIDAVRIELGNTGSKSTIQRYLKELADQSGAQLPDLSEELSLLIASVAERLKQEAEAAVAAERETVQRQQQEYRSHRQLSAERIALLQALTEDQTIRISDLEVRLEAAQARCQSHEVERSRLEQTQQGLQQLMSERAEQIRSLEEKHQHARDSLEHFRQAALEQREYERQQYSQQIKQLQAEVRTMQTGLNERLTELTLLNRANERLLAINTAHTAHQRLLEQELRSQRMEIDSLRNEGTLQLASLARAEEQHKQQQQQLDRLIASDAHHRELAAHLQDRLLVKTSDSPTEITPV